MIIKFKQNKKDVLRWIKSQTDKLDPKVYLAFPKYFKPRLVNVAKEGEEPKYEMWTAEPTEYPSNNFRRAKRAYLHRGIVGLTDFFQKFGYNLQTNVENDQ